MARTEPREPRAVQMRIAEGPAIYRGGSNHMSVRSRLVAALMGRGTVDAALDSGGAEGVLVMKAIPRRGWHCIPEVPSCGEHKYDVISFTQ